MVQGGETARKWRAAINRPGDSVARRMVGSLMSVMSDDFIKGVYARYRNDPLVKFKDSIKKVVGLARPTKEGLEV